MQTADVLQRLTRQGDESFAARTFVALAQQFARCEPRDQKRFTQAMKCVLDFHPRLLARADAAEAFLVPFAVFARIDPDNRLLSPIEEAVVDMWDRGCGALRELPVAAGPGGIVDRCTAVWQRLRDHPNNKVHDAARRWLDQRAPK
jgi:hypothetical protein